MSLRSLNHMVCFLLCVNQASNLRVSPCAEDKPEGQKTTTPAFSFDQPAEVPKPTFSFGTPVSSASNQPSVPTFSFDKSQEKKASETPASTSTAPKFSFAAPAPAPASSTSPALDKGPSPFNFPANAASTDKPSAEKASTTSSAAATTASSPFGGFSFKTPEASKPATTSSVPAPSPGTAFTFTSTSAEADKPVSTTTSSSTFSFGTEAPLAASKESSSTTSESGRKRKSSDQPSATESSRQKLLHGKSPLSQSWSAEEDNGDAAKKGLSTAGSGSTLVSGLSGAIPTRKRSVDNAGITQTTNAPGKKALTEIQNKENHTTDKHVSFKDTPSSKSSDKSKTASTDKPETISPFKPLQSKPIEIPSSEQASSATKSQSTPKDIFGPPAPTTAEQTTLESKITNPESIEKRTRYRDLPGTAQNELNALSLFITQQMDISKTIETRQSAYNGELIREIDTYADNCAKELRLQRDLHEVTQQNIEALTSTVDYQLKNAMVGQLFFENKNTQGRSKPGTTIHQRYFNDLAASLETRVKEYRSAINQIDERIQTMVDGSLAETTTPEQIPSILKSQSNTLIALAAKVAELHQETEKLKRNCRNITK
ncbi:hypothetical protein BDB00DRAFT_257239 [Zychaea mexicana]|uniref:uncharacterized protein n=1 Tax=Zychaea mexicana TaxID=64656 RepID=UPI0022FE5E27|nr:uncharacterized protein BDB00DRAFT_257239 [Zychaea mexicana]KAI9495211.1 hypothetical protein BDB00DRAFT_257239 [Zychaea mexicana]